MKRVYLLVALFGFFSALLIIFAPHFLTSETDLPALNISAAVFLQYYFLSLTFFVVFTMAAVMKARSLHRDQPVRWLGLSLISFSAGSWLAILSFFLFLGWAFTRLSPSF